MILDALLQFSANQAVTVTADSTNTIDLGINGLPTAANGGGARDIGIGDDPAMKILVEVGTAFTGGTSLAVSIQGAPDSGSGTPGTYAVLISSQVIVLANLVAGAHLLDIDMPSLPINVPLPRYLKLTYTVVGTMTAGTLSSYIVLDRDDQIVGTNGVYSGYPQGINIPN